MYIYISTVPVVLSGSLQSHKGW